MIHRILQFYQKELLKNKMNLSLEGHKDTF